jgi:hypothetical protein
LHKGFCHFHLSRHPSHISPISLPYPFQRVDIITKGKKQVKTSGAG